MVIFDHPLTIPLKYSSHVLVFHFFKVYSIYREPGEPLKYLLPDCWVKWLSTDTSEEEETEFLLIKHRITYQKRSDALPLLYSVTSLSMKGFYFHVICMIDVHRASLSSRTGRNSNPKFPVYHRHKTSPSSYKNLKVCCKAMTTTESTAVMYHRKRMSYREEDKQMQGLFSYSLNSYGQNYLILQGKTQDLLKGTHRCFSEMDPSPSVIKEAKNPLPFLLSNLEEISLLIPN